jgi:hypothetical protein
MLKKEGKFKKYIFNVLFVFTRKGNSKQPVWFYSEFFFRERPNQWLNEPITPFSFFPPFAFFPAPQN